MVREGFTYNQLTRGDVDIALHLPEEYGSNQPGGFASMVRWLEQQYRHNPTAIQPEKITGILKDYEYQAYYITYGNVYNNDTIWEQVI